MSGFPMKKPAAKPPVEVAESPVTIAGATAFAKPRPIVPIQANVTEDIYRQVKELAASNKRSMATLLRMIVEEALQRRDSKVVEWPK